MFVFKRQSLCVTLKRSKSKKKIVFDGSCLEDCFIDRLFMIKNQSDELIVNIVNSGCALKC